MSSDSAPSRYGTIFCAQILLPKRHIYFQLLLARYPFIGFIATKKEKKLLASKFVLHYSPTEDQVMVFSAT